MLNTARGSAIADAVPRAPSASIAAVAPARTTPPPYRVVSGIALSVQSAGAVPAQVLRFHKSQTPVVTVGRKPSTTADDSEQVVNDSALFRCQVMSRRHAKFAFSDSGFAYVVDLRSHHGTYILRPSSIVQDKVAPEVPVQLADGDIVVFGKTVGRGSASEVLPVSVRVQLLFDAPLATNTSRSAAAPTANGVGHDGSVHPITPTRSWGRFGLNVDMAAGLSPHHTGEDESEEDDERSSSSPGSSADSHGDSDVEEVPAPTPGSAQVPVNSAAAATESESQSMPVSGSYDAVMASLHPGSSHPVASSFSYPGAHGQDLAAASYSDPRGVSVAVSDSIPMSISSSSRSPSPAPTRKTGDDALDGAGASTNGGASGSLALGSLAIPGLGFSRLPSIQNLLRRMSSRTPDSDHALGRRTPPPPPVLSKIPVQAPALHLPASTVSYPLHGPVRARTPTEGPEQFGSSLFAPASPAVGSADAHVIDVDGPVAAQEDEDEDSLYFPGLGAPVAAPLPASERRDVLPPWRGRSPALFPSPPPPLARVTGGLSSFLGFGGSPALASTPTRNGASASNGAVLGENLAMGMDGQMGLELMMDMNMDVSDHDNEAEQGHEHEREWTPLWPSDHCGTCLFEDGGRTPPPAPQLVANSASGSSAILGLATGSQGSHPAGTPRTPLADITERVVASQHEDDDDMPPLQELTDAARDATLAHLAEVQAAVSTALSALYKNEAGAVTRPEHADEDEDASGEDKDADADADADVDGDGWVPYDQFDGVYVRLDSPAAGSAGSVSPQLVQQDDEEEIVEFRCGLERPDDDEQDVTMVGEEPAAKVKATLVMMQDTLRTLRIARGKQKARLSSHVRSTATRFSELVDRVDQIERDCESHALALGGIDADAGDEDVLTRLDNGDEAVEDVELRLGAVEDRLERLEDAIKTAEDQVREREREREPSAATLLGLVQEMRTLRAETEEHLARTLDVVMQAKADVLAAAAVVSANPAVGAPAASGTTFAAGTNAEESNAADASADADADADMDADAGHIEPPSVLPPRLSLKRKRSVSDGDVSSSQSTGHQDGENGSQSEDSDDEAEQEQATRAPKRAKTGTGRKIAGTVLHTVTAAAVGAVATWSVLAFT